VLENIEKVTTLDMKDNLLKCDTSLAAELFILLQVPGEVLYGCILAQCVPFAFASS